MFKEDKSSTRSFPENNVVTHKCEVDWPSRGSPNRFILEANEKTSRLFWAPWKLLPGGPQQAIIWHFMVSELQLKWSTMCHMSKKGRINKTTLDWHIHRCCNMLGQKCRILLYLKKTGMRRLNAYNNLYKYQAFFYSSTLGQLFDQPRSSSKFEVEGAPEHHKELTKRSSNC